MSEIIGIVGPVSSGKTTAARNLKSEETYFINCLSKKLPFKGSAKAYSAEKKNIANTDKSKEICALLKGVSAKRPEIKYIIVDDVSYTMSNEFFRRREESGYQKFSDIGGNMVDIIDTARSLRDDLTVIFMFHEHIDDNALQPTKKIKTIGKMVDDKWTLEGLFTILLYTKVEESMEETTYNFVTNRITAYPAKSPMGMFESRLIPNDLVIVLEAREKYYG